MADLPDALGPLLLEARARLAAASIDDPALDARL
ncbi:protein-(glutamine-N5) methyltransferase, release factor-specific, partial [Mesorhizobium sp. M7A.F.Ca.US.006.01.1.1]